MSRRTWLLLHRWAGLFMAGFLVVAGLTGSVIVFEHEFDRWLNPHLLVVAPQGNPLPPAELHAIAARAVPTGRIDVINLRRAPDESAVFPVTPRDKGGNLGFNVIHVDPYTGQVLGTRELGTARFDREHIVAFLYRLHYTLALPEPWGRWLFGVVALIWTLDCFVGVYLTLPRRLFHFLTRWVPAWQIKWRASAARINFDLHRAAALWTWAMLLVLAVSSVQLNLYSELFAPVLGKLLPLENVRENIRRELSTAGRTDATPMAWDAALARGRELIAQRAKRDGFTVEAETSLSLGRALGVYAYRLRSTLDIDNRYGRTIMYFSASDGRELAFEHPHIASGNAVIRWLAMLHFGHVW
ncbi:MAG TPA: PepSY-associated TM helix domain-containing protein [Burkholderiales bacterium]|nr:PepSY-associated TM helix domain-containing protein [Burkholderiales bacterium]